MTKHLTRGMWKGSIGEAYERNGITYHYAVCDTWCGIIDLENGKDDQWSGSDVGHSNCIKCEQVWRDYWRKR